MPSFIFFNQLRLDLHFKADSLHVVTPITSVLVYKVQSVGYAVTKILFLQNNGMESNVEIDCTDPRFER